jgi:hypothetical protein
MGEAEREQGVTSAAQPRRRLGSRTRDLAERRLSLVRLLIAIFVSRWR